MKKEKKDGKKGATKAPEKTVEDLYRVAGQMLQEELEGFQHQGLSSKESKDLSKLAKLIADGVLGEMGL